MTKREAVKRFKQFFHNWKKLDKPCLSMSWCIYIDNLHRYGKITNKQAQNWDNPFYK